MRLGFFLKNPKQHFHCIIAFNARKKHTAHTQNNTWNIFFSSLSHQNCTHHWIQWLVYLRREIKSLPIHCMNHKIAIFSKSIFWDISSFWHFKYKKNEFKLITEIRFHHFLFANFLSKTQVQVGSSLVIKAMMKFIIVRLGRISWDFEIEQNQYIRFVMWMASHFQVHFIIPLEYYNKRWHRTFLYKIMTFT